MHSPKWTPPLWLLMLRLASSTTGWMSEVSSRQRARNNLLSRAESTCSVMAQWEIYGKRKVWLVRAPRLKIYRAHSCRDQPVSSVTAGVHNVLLQCYIFITVAYAYTWACAWDPYPIEPCTLGTVSAARERRALRRAFTAAVRRAFLPGCSLWLPLCLFSAGTFN